MLFRVARLQELKAGNRAVRVKRNQEVIRAGVTDNMVRVRRRREQAADGIAASIHHEVQAALGILKLNPVGLGQKFPRHSQRDGRTPLRLVPA